MLYNAATSIYAELLERTRDLKSSYQCVASTIVLSLDICSVARVFENNHLTITVLAQCSLLSILTSRAQFLIFHQQLISDILLSAR